MKSATSSKLKALYGPIVEPAQAIKVPARVGRPDTNVAPRATKRCAGCGRRFDEEDDFCPACGVARTADGALALRTKSCVMRRGLAEFIDRAAPLPLIAFAFPRWAWAVFAYHLLCDLGGRSLGKRICRLRVVTEVSRHPCPAIQAVIRRAGKALCQLAYCWWLFVPAALAYELASVLFVWLHPEGRSIEDCLTGTRVVGEGEYRKWRRTCRMCGEQAPVAARYCPHCGTRNTS